MGIRWVALKKCHVGVEIYLCLFLNTYTQRAISSEKKKDLYNSNLNWIKSNPHYIEELSDRKSERDTIQKLQSDTDVSIVKGKLKSKGIKINKSFDLQKLEKFEKIRDQIRWWGPSTVMQIEDEALRHVQQQLQQICMLVQMYPKVYLKVI